MSYTLGMYTTSLLPKPISNLNSKQILCKGDSLRPQALGFYKNRKIEIEKKNTRTQTNTHLFHSLSTEQVHFASTSLRHDQPSAGARIWRQYRHHVLPGQRVWQRSVCAGTGWSHCGHFWSARRLVQFWKSVSIPHWFRFQTWFYIYLVILYNTHSDYYTHTHTHRLKRGLIRLPTSNISLIETHFWITYCRSFRERFVPSIHHYV